MANTDYMFLEPDDDTPMEAESRSNLTKHLHFMKEEFESCIPACAELTLALRKLQEVQFWVQEAVGNVGLKKPLFSEEGE